MKTETKNLKNGLKVMKKITEKFLKENTDCGWDIRFAKQHNLIGLPAEKFIKKLMLLGRFDYANWLIVRLMNKKQKTQYAISAAEEVRKIYEDKHPDDSRPRKAIEAAKAYLKNPSRKTKVFAAAAHAAVVVVAAAVDSAYADSDVADSAYAAADADSDAVVVADAAVAAVVAASDAARAARAASATASAAYAFDDLKLKIIKNGLKLLK